MTKLLPHLEKYDHIIWDWNGTLVNDVQIAVDAVCALLKKHNLPEISIEEYKKIFRFPVIEYYKDLGYDFNKTPFELLCSQFAEEYNLKRAKHAQLFEGAKEVLSHVNQFGKQSILSAAEQNHLNEIVSHFNIQHHFDYIYGIHNHMAESKVHRGLELIKDSKINPKKTILIGDTDHDREVAEHLGVDILLIADGHQSYDRLKDLPAKVLPTRY